MERNIKRFIIEVEEGKTECCNCFANVDNNCNVPYGFHCTIDCDKYNLTTLKIKEYEDKD